MAYQKYIKMKSSLASNTFFLNVAAQKRWARILTATNIQTTPRE